MMKIFPAIVILILSCSFLYAQSSLILNDQCAEATGITIGQTLTGLDNNTATTTETETPEAIPVTCIKSFENDLWFTFDTEAGYNWYEVIVDPLSCNTPAGLQALIIESADCEAENFLYRACRNPRAEQELTLFLNESVAGKRFLIHVDGYDGTQCAFNVTLNGYEDNPQTTNDDRQLQNDYGMPPPVYEPAAFDVKFLNNEAIIRWSADSREETRLFQIQKLYNSRSRYGQVLQTFEPANTVGLDGTVDYEYIDNRNFIDGEEYCYRIVRVAPQGTKSYTQPICFEAEVMEDFFISQVFLSDNPGIYMIKFINKKKQDLSYIVLDENQQELKRMVRKNEPLQDGTITIDMTAYPPGTYHLQVKGKKEIFQRKFIVE